MGTVLALLALCAFAASLIVNRMVRTQIRAAAEQRVKIGGNNIGSISQSQQNSGNATQSTASAAGGGLSTIADVLQIVGFVILVLQLFKIIPSA